MYPKIKDKIKGFSIAIAVLGVIAVISAVLVVVLGEFNILVLVLFCAGLLLLLASGLLYAFGLVTSNIVSVEDAFGGEEEEAFCRFLDDLDEAQRLARTEEYIDKKKGLVGCSQRKRRKNEKTV